MPFVPAPGVASLQAIFTCSGQNVENTFHYHRGTAWDNTSLTALCNTYMTWLTGQAGLMSGSTGLIKCYARDLTTETSPSVEVVPVTPIVGTDAGALFPNNVTWALKRLTGLAGRKNRGRLYMIGLTTTMVTPEKQHMNGTWAASFASAYDGLLTGQVSANSAQEVILHRALGTFTNVTHYGWSDLTLDSQRRRLPDHNIHH